MTLTSDMESFSNLPPLSPTYSGEFRRFFTNSLILFFKGMRTLALRYLHKKKSQGARRPCNVFPLYRKSDNHETYFLAKWHENYGPYVWTLGKKLWQEIIHPKINKEKMGRLPKGTLNFSSSPVFFSRRIC